MATRLYTSFLLPTEEDESKGKYWIDVVEDYDSVFEKLFPLAPATSSLEARQSFFYTKQSDGFRFSCHPSQILGFEEVTVE